MFFPVNMSDNRVTVPNAAAPVGGPYYQTANGAFVGPDGRVSAEVVAGYPWACRGPEGTVLCVLCHRRRGSIIGRRSDLYKHALTDTHIAYYGALQQALGTEQLTNDAASVDSDPPPPPPPAEAAYYQRVRDEVSAEFTGKPWAPFTWPEYSCDFLPYRAIVLSHMAGTSWSRNRRVRRLVSHVYRNDFVLCYVALTRVLFLSRFEHSVRVSGRRRSRRLVRQDSTQDQAAPGTSGPSTSGQTMPGMLIFFF